MWVVPDIVKTSAERYGDRLAIADPGTQMSYSELAASVFGLSQFLRKEGLQDGDRVAIALPNSVRFIESHLGIITAGGISVPLDFGIAENNFIRICENCAPRFLIADKVSMQRVGIAAETNCLERIFLYGNEFNGDGSKIVLNLENEIFCARSTNPTNAKVDSGSVASLMYTTGTTGRAKGVPLMHSNIEAALRNICNFIGYSKNDREIVILPLSHNFGLCHVYCNLLNGGAVYTENGLARVGRVLKKLSKFGATGFPGTPTGFGLLIDKYAPVLAEHGKGLRFSVINSAPLPPERTAQLHSLLPDLNILVYYGLTEASRSTFISLSKIGPKYYRSVGRPMPNLSVEILENSGLKVEQGGIGEIVISGPTVVDGYWNNPDLNRITFKDGKIHTGDLGYIDPDGNLFITGRMKDFINVGGYKINPIEVEDVIIKYNGIEDVGVTGVEGLFGMTGDSVVAGIVVEDKAWDANALEKYCLKHLEKFKIPVAFLRIDTIPRTNTGKARRKELRDLLIDQIK